MTIEKRLNPARLAAGCLVLLAATWAAAAADDDTDKKAAEPVPEPTEFVSEHQGRFNGQALRYRVRAGETYLRDADGKPKASIFSFDYVASGGSGRDGDPARPVTFVWNGGPGSASLWLHMGSLGPRRVAVPTDAGHAGPPPYKVLDAPETILDVTDLVFVDPVGTGFSRALGEHEGKEFWGLSEDAMSMAEFIREWITVHGRWNSPRFLLGESFGTTRAAAVAQLLESDAFMIGLNGIVFISQALDYTGSSPYVRDNLIAHVTYLPTMSAAAWYHDRVQPRPPQLEPYLAESRAFAVGELLPALFRGNQLTAAERSHVRDRLAYFTGLSPDYIERSNLRVQGFRFAKELLRDRGLAIGLLDARYVSDEVDDLASDPAGDAADIAVSAAFKAALMDYMRSDLGIDWDRLYLAPADEDLNRLWRWRPTPDEQPWEPMPVNTAPDLSLALHRNPRLRVLVACGYYDLVTPFFDAEYTLHRHDIPADRIDYRYYGGGHMMYVNEPSRTQLLEDTRQFIRAQLAR